MFDHSLIHLYNFYSSKRITLLEGGRKQQYTSRTGSMPEQGKGGSRPKCVFNTTDSVSVMKHYLSSNEKDLRKTFLWRMMEDWGRSVIR